MRVWPHLRHIKVSSYQGENKCRTSSQTLSKSLLSNEEKISFSRMAYYLGLSIALKQHKGPTIHRRVSARKARNRTASTTPLFTDLNINFVQRGCRTVNASTSLAMDMFGVDDGDVTIWKVDHFRVTVS